MKSKSKGAAKLKPLAGGKHNGKRLTSLSVARANGRKIERSPALAPEAVEAQLPVGPTKPATTSGREQLPWTPLALLATQQYMMTTIALAVMRATWGGATT